MEYRNQLPEKWAILRTPDNYKMVNEWADKKDPDGYTADGGYIHSESVRHKGATLVMSSVVDGYTEITTEEFKVLVLGQKLSVTDLKENECIHVSTEEESDAIKKLMHSAGMKWGSGSSLIDYMKGSWISYKENSILTNDVSIGSINYAEENNYTIYPASWFINNNTSTMEKEIIGWKMKPEYQEYEQAACKIVNAAHLVVLGDGAAFLDNSTVKKSLEKAGVLQLWFNPVHRNEYKVGDWVTVEKENSCNTYRRGEIFKIENLFNSGNTHCRKENTSIGIPLINVRPATQEEIANAQVETIQMAEGFQLTIKDKKVFHGSEDITSYVIGMGNWYTDRPTAFGDKHKTWTVNFKDVVFSRTGCELKETKLSQWLAIYDKIK